MYYPIYICKYVVHILLFNPVPKCMQRIFVGIIKANNNAKGLGQSAGCQALLET